VSVRFRVNNPHVISETIQGEVIVIHLDTGTYYSLRDAGAEIWRSVENGVSTDTIVDSLGERYQAPREELADATVRLLSELEAEGLVAPVDAETNGAAPLTAVPDRPTGEREPFKAPAVEKYTDMQDLILLDPVHEVGERGWPHVQPDAAS
jgi:Coenzyme PQQ synthesis protein D (PqqD)